MLSVFAGVVVVVVDSDDLVSDFVESELLPPSLDLDEPFEPFFLA